MISATFESEGKCSFLLQAFASWHCRGWVYNNQNQTRVVLTQPLCPTSTTPPHDSFTLRNVPREGRTRAWRTCKLARLQGDFGELGIVATRLIHQHRPPCQRLHRQRHRNIHRWAGRDSAQRRSRRADHRLNPGLALQPNSGFFSPVGFNSPSLGIKKVKFYVSYVVCDVLSFLKMA